MTGEQDILLKALKDEQEGAFGQLYKKYYNLLYFKALSIVGEATAAEDLVQECFIRMWEKKLWKGVNKSLESFMFMMVHNKCLDYVRSQQALLKRKNNYLTIVKDEPADWESAAEEQEQEHVQQQRWDSFQVRYGKLPPQQQAALKMFYYDRKSHAESAKLIGVSLNTFRTHLKRALKKLLHSS